MKFKKLLILTVLVLPLVAGQAAFAQVPDDGVEMGAAGDSREQRVKTRKDKVERRLTQSEQTTVKTRCSAAAGLVKANQSRIKSFAARRTKVYSGLVTRFEELSPKLKAAGVDTMTYDEQVATLKSKSDAYSDSIEALQQAIDDLVSMDCAADPEGFVVTLKEAARLREDVIEKGRDFRAYLKDTFKITFEDIRTQLKAKNTEGEE